MAEFFYDKAKSKLYILDEAELTMLDKVGGSSDEEEPTQILARRGRKPKETGNKKWQALGKEEQHKRGKSHVSEEDKRAVEDALIDGMSVGEAFEKFGGKLDVSIAWFYLVRNRLKKEGRLA